MILGKGIIMSKNKGGRPDVWNADYFPHAVKTSNELRYLEHTHGAEGYRAYWRILEQLAFTDYHFVKLENEYDWTTFRINCNVDKDILDDVIKYLLDRGILDEELYKENKLWSPYLIEKLRPLYERGRRKKAPKKQGKDIVITCDNSQDSKVKETKAEKTKDKKNKAKGSYTPINESHLKEFKESYKDIDVDKSYEKYLKYYKDKNPSIEGFAIWLDEDEINGHNMKEPEWSFYKTGLVRVYCAKCNTKGFANTTKDAKHGESCCGVEWLPEPHA